MKDIQRFVEVIRRLKIVLSKIEGYSAQSGKTSSDELISDIDWVKEAFVNQ